MTKWSKAIEKIDEIVSSINEAKTYLYDNRYSLSDSVLDQARLLVSQIASNIKELAILILEAGV